MVLYVCRVIFCFFPIHCSHTASCTSVFPDRPCLVYKLQGSCCQMRKVRITCPIWSRSYKSLSPPLSPDLFRIISNHESRSGPIVISGFISNLTYFTTPPLSSSSRIWYNQFLFFISFLRRQIMYETETKQDFFYQMLWSQIVLLEGPNFFFKFCCL